MDEHQPKPARTGIQKFTLFAGVIMPVISITVEATTHICAETFFDPIPTMWHLLLVIFVPLAQLHVWFVVRRGANPRPVLTGLVNAVAIGVSLFYSFVYIPLLPLAALTLLFVIGILPLAPFAFIRGEYCDACSAQANRIHGAVKRALHSGRPACLQVSPSLLLRSSRWSFLHHSHVTDSSWPPLRC